MAVPPPPATNPYLTLSVPADASPATIRSSYKKLMLQCHPDKVRDEPLLRGPAPPSCVARYFVVVFLPSTAVGEKFICLLHLLEHGGFFGAEGFVADFVGVALEHKFFCLFACFALPPCWG